MDAGDALDELTRLSAEIEHAVLLDDSGGVVAATEGIDERRLARIGSGLLEVGGGIDPGRMVERVIVSLPRGAVVAVRGESHVAVAATRAEPPVALVVHDLRACLEQVAAPRRRPARRRKAQPTDA